MTKKRVLIIYFSFSSQTRNLLQAFAGGLEEQDIEVYWQQIKPVRKLQFPLGSISSTLVLMIGSFFRKRIEIEPIEKECFAQWDLVVLAGPTWSYSPSGPVLSLFDNYGELFNKKRVLSFISCRAYWRLHFWNLRYMLRKKGAKTLNPIIFLHSGAEPWLTIGVFLKLAGKVPESGRSWLSRYYTKYGHTREQVEHAGRLGSMIGENIKRNEGCRDISIPPIKEVSTG